MHPWPSFADTGTGLQMALAIAAAYVQQQRTGEGQLIELSMQKEVTIFMHTLGLMNWGTEPAPRNGIHHGGATTSTYPCTGDGPNDWVFIMVTTQPMWDALWTVVGRTDILADERFADLMARIDHAAELCAELARWTRQRTKREVMDTLGPAGVPSAMSSTRWISSPTATSESARSSIRCTIRWRAR